MSCEETFRIIPGDWLNPMPVDSMFPHPGRPLEVDVGCGKGRFLLAHAEAHPDVNLLGVDRMLRRIRKIDRKAGRRKLENIRLLRMEAYYATTYLVPAESVTAYYIFFPDPWPKKKHHKHRLFDDRYMDALHRTLVPGGAVHFATDHLPYCEEVRGLLAADKRFSETEPYVPTENERTDFELWYIRRGEIGRCSVRKEVGA